MDWRRKAILPERKVPARTNPQLGSVIEFIDEILPADQQASPQAAPHGTPHLEADSS